MIRPALYLIARSSANWAWGQVRKLRRPSHVAAVLLGGAYVWFFLRTGSTAPQAYRAGEIIEPVGAIFLALVVFRWWILGADRSALAFSEAEIQYVQA